MHSFHENLEEDKVQDELQQKIQKIKQSLTADTRNLGKEPTKVVPEQILQSKRTTFMVKNIPNRYSKNMLMNEIKENFKDQFDFFYLQIDPKTLCNLGYAFINFKTPEGAQDFYYRWHGQHWEKFNSPKICEISYAKI